MSCHWQLIQTQRKTFQAVLWNFLTPVDTLTWLLSWTSSTIAFIASDILLWGLFKYAQKKQLFNRFRYFKNRAPTCGE